MANLTTLAAVKQWLQLTGTTASDDLLNTLIASCSAYIEAWLSRSILQATYTETRNGVGSPIMVLRQFPIISVASVSLNGNTLLPRPPLSPSMTVTGTDYPGYVFDDVSVMLDGGVFYKGFQNVTIVYDAGYATVPPDIDHACVEMIGDWFTYKGRIGVLSQSIEGQTTSFTDIPITKRARGVLDQYRRMFWPS